MSILDITKSEMYGAKTIILGTASVPDYFRSEFGSDKAAGFATTQPFALLSDDFVFHATKGATYQVFSTSFFDPFILRVSDLNGLNIAFDAGDIYSPYGIDHVQFKAGYNGDYYAAASWDQGSAKGNALVSLQIYEDLDTAIDYDRIFNWAEDQFNILLPGDSHTQYIDGYNARLYGNHAVGERDGEIYYYDGDNIEHVGQISDFIGQAVSSGY